MSKRRIIQSNALLLFLTIVGYFFIMKLVGLEDQTGLRLLNFAFVFFFVNRAIKQNMQQRDDYSYLSNLFLGVTVSGISVVLTIICLAFYVNNIDPTFLIIMSESQVWGPNISPWMAVIGTGMEGFASSVICSFILMQYWKRKMLKSSSWI